MWKGINERLRAGEGRRKQGGSVSCSPGGGGTQHLACVWWKRVAPSGGTVWFYGPIPLPFRKLFRRPGSLGDHLAGDIVNTFFDTTCLPLIFLLNFSF